MKIDIEKIVIEHLKSETFAYALAETIAQQYSSQLFDEFGGEIAKNMHKEIEKLTKQFIDDFGKSDDVKRAVDSTISGITKKDLLEKL